MHTVASKPSCLRKQREWDDPISFVFHGDGFHTVGFRASTTPPVLVSSTADNAVGSDLPFSHQTQFPEGITADQNSYKTLAPKQRSIQPRAPGWQDFYQARSAQANSTDRRSSA